MISITKEEEFENERGRKCFPIIPDEDMPLEQENYIIIRKFNKSPQVLGQHVISPRLRCNNAENSTVVTCDSTTYKELITEYIQSLITENTLKFLNNSNASTQMRLEEGMSNEILFYSSLFDLNCLNLINSYFKTHNKEYEILPASSGSIFFNIFYDNIQKLKIYLLSSLKYNTFDSDPSILFKYELPGRWQWTNIIHITPAALDGEGVTKIIIYGKSAAVKGKDWNILQNAIF